MADEDQLKLYHQLADWWPLLDDPAVYADNFRPSTDCGGRDLDGRGLRYLEWTWDPDPDDTSYVADYAFVLRQTDGSVEVVLDRHVEGLFWRADWLRLLADVGFEASAVRFDHSELDPGQYEILVGKRPA